MIFNEAWAGGSLPLQGSTLASSWDHLYLFLVWISVFFFILVVGAMIYFAVKYHHSVVKKTQYITGSHILEGIWIVVPTILLLGIFAWGYFVYHEMVQPPADAYEIRVIGRQWSWQFQYDTGKTTNGDLYVPLNRPVRLVMTSEDVLHSFFIPNFRIKQDVVPKMYTSVWFEATVPGRHQIYCAEYCGTSHSGMLGNVVVLDEHQWKDWISGRKLGEIPRADQMMAVQEGGPQPATAEKPAAEQAGLTLVSMSHRGKTLFNSRGCVACHSMENTRKIGPGLKDLYGSSVRLNNGKSVVANDQYLRNSIMNPMGEIVEGYPSSMPMYEGQLSGAEVNDLIAFIRSLSSKQNQSF